MQVRADDLSDRLVKLTREAARSLQRGDLVYEPHHASPSIVKYNALRVHTVEGGGEIVVATRVDCPRGESHRKIRCGMLKVERKPEPMSRTRSTPTAPIIALPPNAPTQVDYTAFRDMGQSLLEAVERDVQALNEAHASLSEKREERSAMGRRMIEHHETMLARARKSLADELALVTLEIDEVIKQLDDASARLTWLRSMPGTAK